MKIITRFLSAVLALCLLTSLCLPARAIELPDGLNGAVPDELLESAQEEGLMTRGAAYLWETLFT